MDSGSVALLAVLCCLLEILVGRQGVLADQVPDFQLVQALQVGVGVGVGVCGGVGGWGGEGAVDGPGG